MKLRIFKFDLPDDMQAEVSVTFRRIPSRISWSEHIVLIASPPKNITEAIRPLVRKRK